MSAAAGSGAGKSFLYAPGTRRNAFERLFRVVVTHTYYTQDAGLCRDLRFTPDSASASLMASLGMLFKEEEAGFSVLIQPRAIEGLVQYLRRQARSGLGPPEYWTRLTFLMTMVNPQFVGVTAVPISTKPTEVNFYANNMTAHGSGDSVVLPPRRYMDGGTLVPVTGSQMTVPVTPGAAYVALADLSGAVVHRFPITLSDKATNPTRVTIDLGQCAYGYYTISLEGADEQAIDDRLYPRQALYVPPRPVTMGALEILFTRPTPDSRGVYPLRRPSHGKQAVTPENGLTYRLPFDARSTYWQYYVVAQDAGGTLEDLDITGTGTSFRRQPHPVRLPDGASAILFEAQDALPLRQKSPQRFRLTGRRRDTSGQENDLLISRLPVAPASPVWPAPQQTDAGSPAAGRKGKTGTRSLSSTDGQNSGQDSTGTSEIFIYV